MFRLLARAGLPFLLLIAACGAEIEPASTNVPPGANGAGTGTANPSNPDPKEEETASVVAPLVQVRNTSSAPRWIALDFQSTPVDFEVGVPAMQLNGYGSYWCGGPTSNHNDPGVRVAKIEPGEVSKNMYWRAISVTRESDCWKGTPLAPGAYPTKACFYESEPDGLAVPGDTSATVPLTCVDVTLTIAASGTTVLDF